MKITGIQIGRFGVWQQLSLSVPGRGMAVFYGPNEAGKTTLFRFLRSVLYGFEPFGVELHGSEIVEVTSRSAGWEGSLRVEAQGHSYEIRRRSDRGTRGLVSVVGTDRQEPAETLLAELLHNTEESLFENVFAVGLSELQELATLQGDEVSRHIYGMSLGPMGRKLLATTTALEREQSGLFDNASRSGRLPELLTEQQALQDAILAQYPVREKHADLCSQRRKVEERIEGLKQKQADAERQLAGHRVLERVWPCWERARAYRQELETIPEVSLFPPDGPAHLKKLEAEIDSAKQTRQTLIAEIKTLHDKMRGLSGHRKLHTHTAALVGFIEQAGWYRDISQEAAAAQSRASEIKRELDALLETLGGDWTTARLESIDVGTAAHRRMMAAGARYRSAVRRRNRLVRLQKRLNRSLRKRTAYLDERLKELGKLSLEETIAEQSAQLKGLERLGSLRLRETELTSRRDRLTAPQPEGHEQAELPRWVPAFLVLLFIVGLMATIVGICQTALTTDIFAGASLAFIGLTGLGVWWGLKRHDVSGSLPTAEHRQIEIKRVEAQLRETADSIHQLVASGGGTSHLPGRESEHDCEILRQTIARLMKLERWNCLRQMIQTKRRRLSELRSRFPSVQRDLSMERQSWCSLLTELGLPETLKVEQTLEAWRRIAEGQERLRAWKAVVNEARQLERSAQSFRTRMAEAARRAGHAPRNDEPVLDTLAAWETDLKSLSFLQEECRRTRHELTDRRRKLRQTRRRLLALRSRRSALFIKGGAGDRREFLERAEWAARRQECAELLELSNEELHAASQAEPELAIVEEDLEQFDSEQNRRRIASLSSEMEQLEGALHTAFEELGRIKQSLKGVEAACDTSRLRFAESQTRYQLKQAAEEWLGIELTRRALETIRTQFERTCQPAALALASQFLEQLTRGRYRNIWTPLGQRSLRIDDDRGNTFAVEELSGGTREQLFLAVRMATVRELALKGIELPMIFDDVLVNFDQLRTEAAVDALLEFAEENQQVFLFTCHLHLAHLFESRGIEPTWLPGHNLPQQERRAG